MQASLFGDDAGASEPIPGLVYQPDFLSAREEAGLIEIVRALPLEPARYKAYTARRKVASYGGSFDYDSNTLQPAQALDTRLAPLRDRVAAWLGLPADHLVHALVAEYAPGTPLGWHRDVPDFEIVCGVSLGSAARLRFRRYPPAPGAPGRAIELRVEPRSIYRIAGAARWDWQHSVSPTEALRWSVTFRTARPG